MSTTYALLGATGATGSAILRSLLASPPRSLALNILVRSKSRLLTAVPSLASPTSTPFPITIAESPSVIAQPALQTTLAGAAVIFVCVASNDSVPGMSVCHDMATAIVSALKSLRAKDPPAFTTPTVILLRSAGLNPFLPGPPPWGVTILHFCLHYAYTDLAAAAALYATAATDEPGLLDWIYVDPPAIHDPDGRTCTGYRLLTKERAKEDQGSKDVSYADLGAAFCEVAERRGEFKEESVGVAATGAVATDWPKLVGNLVYGVRGRLWW